MFSADTYAARRKELVARVCGEGGKGILLFLGNVESPAQYRDNCYKWRQDSNWLYFFGIDEPRMAATIDLESGEEVVYADDFDIDDIIWTGPMPTAAELAATAGVGHSERYDKLAWTISKALIQGRTVHFLPVTRYYNSLRISSLLGISPEEAFSAGKKGCAKASAAFVRAVVAMRLVKSPEEIEILDRTCALGQEMHRIARRGIVAGRIEQEIVGEMEGYALKKGWGTSFATILTQHGEIFHCHSHECPVVPGKLMVIDAGLEGNEHYASDFTRTYPTSGRFDSRQRDIYRTVYECNELAYSLTAPGVAYRDVHLAVEKKMLENLSAIGLVHGDADEMVAAGVCGLFLPHGLGHNMGLDVHDMEDLGENIVGYDDDQTRAERLGLASLRMARRLVPGNVITDEPGIYFIPALIEKWKNEGLCSQFVNFSKLESYYDFGGIRVEDDVLVTPDGARRLGAERLAASPEEVEAAMAEDRER